MILRPTAYVMGFICVFSVFVSCLSEREAQADTTHVVTVDISPNRALNVIDPLRSVGAGVDAQNTGAVELIYTPKNISTMLSSGLGPVSYRLYTELSVQHWHWNPDGKWSDPTGQGYWTGSSQLRSFIRDSFGYRLPHRGFTHDQGNDDDYSRLTDGDPRTYWKSNPYLTSAFTGEPDAFHPQWALVDLGGALPVDAIRIHWSNPYAIVYRLQYWTGTDAVFDPAHGRWIDFPIGEQHGAGGTVFLKLAPRPKHVEFIRIFMTASSGTCDSHGNKDIRNCVGFAIDELDLGAIDSHGVFHDYVHHQSNNQQTTTYVSSVDPWHAPRNRVLDEEQAGLDIVFQRGLTRGLPAMIPVGMLYGTPADAAAELRYLEARHYAVSLVELGEEPDGQFILPEDYGALYIQWARALHAVDPTLKLGGPVFQGVTSDVQAWPDAHGDVSWLHRFLLYLRKHNALSELSFMSFEHYPFDPCDPSIAQDLYSEPAVLRGIMQTWVRDGLPNIPMYITETNFSANSAAVMQAIGGALWMADFEGSFLSYGGSGTFLYQYEPEPLVSSSSNCTSYGAWGMFAGDNNNQIRQRTSQFFAAQLVTQYWAQPVDALQVLFPVALHIRDGIGNELVTAYAIRRSDGTFALLFVNKDADRSHSVTVVFEDRAKNRYYNGAVAASTFGSAQYVWHPNGVNGFANPDGPIVSTTLAGGRGVKYLLPPASITVLRGSVQQSQY